MEKACGLLSGLCQLAPLRKPALSAKAAAALAAAIKKYEDNNKVQECARDAMTNLLKRP